MCTPTTGGWGGGGGGVGEEGYENWAEEKSPLEFEQTSQLADEWCKFADVGAL